MKEKLIDIVYALDSWRKIKKGTGIIPAARINCVFDDKDMIYWLTTQNLNASLYNMDDVKSLGNFVPKNSYIANELMKRNVGSKIEYKILNNIKRLQKHSVHLENRADLQNQTIAIDGDPLLYQYRNVSEFLKALRQNQEDIIEKETQIAQLRKLHDELKADKGTAARRGQITKSINQLLSEYRVLTQQQEDLKNITIYIRKQGEMRYSLIVDPIQTRIKSQNLFDGKTVIINGGPGTGKTTTMIHRLAYLTDIFAIDEDEREKINNFKLNALQRNKLREAIREQKDWIFFSPSQMLKEYLAEAMRKEKLTNTSEKVWNWKDYCRYVLEQKYGLLETSSNKAPFTVCKLSVTLFFQKSGVIQEFTDFYLGIFRQIKEHLPKINTEDKVYAWTSIAQNIGKRFEKSDSFTIPQFVQLFNSLEAVYGEDCKNLLKDKNAAIKELTSDIYSLLENNKDVKSSVEDILELSLEEIDDSSEEDADYTDNDLMRELQKWVKAYCKSAVSEDNSLTDVQLFLQDMVSPLLGENFTPRIKKIGELILFEEYAKYTRGVRSIMLNGIHDKYKKFRIHLNRTKFAGCDQQVLKEVMQQKQGKGLHYQEQSLLLGFINNLVKQIKRTNANSGKHIFIDAYDDVARPIIGIDEATDFCDCDIYAMQSLLTIDYNSLTLCGDMMQRLTAYGIKSWEELNGIVPFPVVVDLKTSYRQSRKLLEVAKQMYEDTISQKPSYKAFMTSKKVPEPLVFVDTDENTKIKWIAKRISEVYRAYGEQLPSIAIFVNDKGYISKFIANLQETDFFKSKNIKVTDGTDDKAITDDNHISVYPIDVVKGMEFDVVFFHNIDNAYVDTERLKRYIYVGVSRAAFFLGITLSEENREICKYFKNNKDWFDITE